MNQPKMPRTKFLGHVTGLAVYAVDGEYVRNKQDIDFVCGGNEAVYPNYVPKGEIWLDSILKPLDATATLLHEIVERNLMVNKGWGYERAHDAASARERPFRRELAKDRPTKIDLPRVEKQLLTKAPKAERKVVHREYPSVRQVGKRRRVAKYEQQIDEYLKGITGKLTGKTGIKSSKTGKPEAPRTSRRR